MLHHRASLLEGAGQNRAPQETDATAGLDNRGIVQLQQSLMQQQDSQVEQLEQSVTNTRVRKQTPKPKTFSPAERRHVHHMIVDFKWRNLTVCIYSNLSLCFRQGIQTFHLVDVQHMALTIDEELSLHNRLLTELDDDVTVTHSRMKVLIH